MQSIPEYNSGFYFFAGAGEMRERIRNKDWSKTSLGDPADWPQSLRTAVSIMLENPFGMYIAWGNDFIQLYNDAYRPILGTTKHPDALGISTIETFAEIWQIIGPMFKTVMSGTAVGFPDFVLPLNRHGFVEDCYFDFSYSPIRVENGEVGGILVTVTETTERKNTEKSIIESEMRFKSLIEEASVPTFLVSGPDMVIELANQAMITVMGKGDSVLGKPFMEALPELKDQGFPGKLREVFETGETFLAREAKVDYLVNGKMSTWYFDYTYKPLKAPNGIVYAIMCTLVDVTEQVLVRRALEKTEQNLRNTIIQAPVAMCIFRGADYIVELANERMYTLMGKRLEDVLNRPVFEAIPEAKNQGFEEILKGVFTTGETFVARDVPISLPRMNTTEQIYINFVLEAYREAGGEISGMMAVAVDVTAQVTARLEIEEQVALRTRELAEVNRILQKSNAELAQFAYIASHDLQEPLRKISTFSQMLENNLGDQLDEKSRNYFNKIISASSRMNTLIRDVLNFSQLVKDNEEYSNVDLNKILEGILGDYELLIEQKNATVTYKGLPVIEAIPLQMAQLFSNLIGNSLKFSRNDVNPRISIETTVLSDEEKKMSARDTSIVYYNIRLIDNGIGFKEEYAEQIFNIFQRLHRKSEFEGTGIGLALCRKIALNHHGDINAIGSSPNGAVFNVVLPATRVSKAID